MGTKYEGKTGIVAQDGVTYSRGVVVNGDVVTVVHVTKCKNGHVYLTNHFDFSNASSEDRLEICGGAMVIKMRPLLLHDTTTDEALKYEGQTFDAMEFFKRERSAKTPRDKAINSLVLAGIPRDTAEFMVDHPDEVEKQRQSVLRKKEK